MNKADPAHLEDDKNFIADMSRFAEGLLSEQYVRARYPVGDGVWETLGEDDQLVKIIEDEKLRRIRSGESKREKAQLHVTAAPDVAASIMRDTQANNRHRLDACKVLDDLAVGNERETAAATERFTITINLGADSEGKPIIEHYDKAITIDAENTDTDSSNDGAGPTPAAPRSKPMKTIAPDDDFDTGIVAAIAARKSRSDGSGNPL